MKSDCVHVYKTSYAFASKTILNKASRFNRKTHLI